MQNGTYKDGSFPPEFARELQNQLLIISGALRSPYKGVDYLWGALEGVEVAYCCVLLCEASLYGMAPRTARHDNQS